MADILLNKSAVSQSISCVPDARFVFGFSPEDATLSRSGDDFVLTFEDGSTITLAGFYTTYSSEQMPSFSVEGAEISGEDFFTAMNEPDLMPAAGPAQQAADGARYRSWANMDLLDGIDRLGGLDVGWQDPTPDDRDEGGADDINWPLSITPGTPADTPDVPAYDENGNAVSPGLVVEHLVVHESALPGGNAAPVKGATSDSGTMIIHAPDGVASLTINGVTVVSGEALTDTLEIATDEGVLTVTGFTFDADSGDGVLEFKFDLSNNTLEHKGEAGENSIGHVFTVTLTDPDNESASAEIFVEVVDDMPEAEGEEGETLREAVVVAESEDDIDSGVLENSGNVLENELYGADGKAAEYVTWGEASVSGDAPLASYGSLALAEDGSWKFVLDTDSDVVKKMSDGDSVTVSVPYTVTDADGDTAQATLTFKIEGADNAVSIVPDPDPVQPGDEPTPPVRPGDDPTYPDQPMVDEDPEVHGDELTVYEAGLEDGTAPGQQDVSVSGSMSIYAPDVLASVVVSFGGSEVELFGGQTASFDIGEAGVFEASYNANTGKLEYTFTLNDDHQHDAKLDSADWTVGVTVKDSDGSADATSIKLTIVDDKPEAHEDYAGLVKANTSLAANASKVTSDEATSLAGSVLTGKATAEGHEAADLEADTLGADGVNSVTWTATATVGGQTVEIVNGKAETDYGTLTLNADGTYSFTIADSAAVQAMAEGATVTVSVGYTITDADGDSSEAALSLKVEGSDDGITVVPSDPESMPDPDQSGEGSSIVAEHLTVHESALENGNPAPEKGETTASGSMKIAAPDGLASIKIGETEVWKNGSLTDTTTVSTDEGVLTVTGYDVAKGELSFSFTLNQATQEHSNQGEDSISHKFAVTVSDKDGDSASSSIVVTIVDDMPKAEPDYAGWVKADTVLPDNADAAVSSQPHTLAGSVLANDQFGADGQHAGSYVSWGEMSVGGTGSLANYGTLELGKDGSYSFVLNNESDIVKAMLDRDSVSVSIDYVITDGDGDTSAAVLTFEIKGADDGITVVPGDPESMPDPDQSGEGSDIVAEHLTVHESALKNGNPAPEKGVFTTSGSMEIASLDGLARIEVAGVEVWNSTTGINADASVPAHSEGSEGRLHGFSYDAESGTLSFQFTLDAATQEHGAQGEDSIAHKFDVTVSDKDGDSASSSIVVTVVDDMPSISAADAEFSTDDDSLGSASSNALFSFAFGADGAAQNPVEYSVAFDAKYLPDGLTALVGGKWQDVTAEGAKLLAGGETVAELVIDGDGKVTFTQYAQFEHGVSTNSNYNDDVLTFTAVATATAKDADGDRITDSADLTITIADSGPKVEAVSNGLTFTTRDHYPDETSIDTESGQLFSFDFGADGAAASGSVVYELSSTSTLQALVDGTWQNVTIEGLEGYVKVNGQKTTVFTLSLNQGEELTHVLQQFVPVKHEMPGKAGDEQIGFGMTLTATAKDGDGDTHSDSIDIALKFNDGGTTFVSHTVKVTEAHEYVSADFAKASFGSPSDAEKFDLDSYNGSNHLTADRGTGSEMVISSANGDGSTSKMIFRSGYVAFGAGNGTGLSDAALTDAYLTDFFSGLSFTEDGKLIHTYGHESYSLGVFDTDVDKKASMSAVRKSEVTYDMASNRGEYVEIELDGYAYNMSIDFKRFYNANHDTTGAERAVLLFYNGDTLVKSQLVTSNMSNGLVSANGQLEIYSSGFDMVRIVAIHNGRSKASGNDNSEFSIGEVKFNTLSPIVVRSASGTVTATSVDEIASYDFDTSIWAGYVVEKAVGSGSTRYIISTRNEDGTLTREFTATIDNESGQWVFLQQNSQMDPALNELHFTAVDKDGDPASMRIDIRNYSNAETTLTTHDAETEGNASDSASHDFELYARAKLREGSYEVEDGNHDVVGTLSVSKDGTVTFVQSEAYIEKDKANDGSTTDKVFEQKIDIVLEDGSVCKGAVTVNVQIVDDTPVFSVPTVDIDHGVNYWSSTSRYNFTHETKMSYTETDHLEMLDLFDGKQSETYAEVGADGNPTGNSFTISTGLVKYAQGYKELGTLLTKDANGKPTSDPAGTNSSNWSTVIENLKLYDTPDGTASIQVGTTGYTPNSSYGTHTYKTETKEVAYVEIAGKKYSLGTLCKTAWRSPGDNSGTDYDHWTLGINNSHVDTDTGWASWNWREEIGYDLKDSTAEAMIIDLNGIAYNMNIDLARCYSNNDEEEYVVILFYNDKKLVDYTILSAADSTGEVTQNGLTSYSEGFNRVVITTVHNGVQTSASQNNSDYTLGAVTFNTFYPAVTHAVSGTIGASSADGVVYAFDTALWKSLGYTVVSKTTFNDIELKVYAEGSEDPLFTASLNQLSGKWNFYQQTDTLPEDFTVLTFTATDGDGDVAIQWVDITESGLYGSSFETSAGNDYIAGTAGADTLYGEGGSDVITGGAGGDTLYGGDGTDILYGQAGDDFLYGGAGDDVLSGGAGADTLKGEGGNDIFVYDPEDLFIQGGDGIDILLSNVNLQHGSPADLNLASLTSAGEDGTAKADGIEMIVKGINAESLTSLDALADMGISVVDGKVSFDSKKGWALEQGSEGTEGDFCTFQQTHIENGSTVIDLEVEVAVSVLQNTNG